MIACVISSVASKHGRLQLWRVKVPTLDVGLRTTGYGVRRAACGFAMCQHPEPHCPLTRSVLLAASRLHLDCISREIDTGTFPLEVDFFLHPACVLHSPTSRLWHQHARGRHRSARTRFLVSGTELFFSRSLAHSKPPPPPPFPLDSVADGVPLPIAYSAGHSIFYIHLHYLGISISFLVIFPFSLSAHLLSFYLIHLSHQRSVRLMISMISMSPFPTVHPFKFRMGSRLASDVSTTYTLIDNDSRSKKSQVIKV